MSKPNIRNAFNITPETQEFFVAEGMPEIGVLRHLWKVLSEFDKRIQELDDRWDKGKANIVFPPNFKLYRQKIIRRIAEESKTNEISRPRQELWELFGKIRSDYPLKREIKVAGVENLTKMSERAYTLTKGVESYLNKRRIFEGDRTYESVRRFNENFSSKFGVLLNTFDKIITLNQFYVDIKTPRIVPAKIPPKLKSIRLLVGKEQIGKETLKEVAIWIRKELKQRTVELHNGIIEDYGESVWKELRGSLIDSEEDNFKTLIKKLEIPIKLYTTHRSFIKTKTHLPWDLKEDLGLERDEGGFDYNFCFPGFGNHFDLRNLFPYQLLDEDIRNWYREYVPINFKTNPGENKFLFVGMNSAGKSYFLKHIVIASLLASMGLESMSDGVLLPNFRRIFYLNNIETSRSGKMESEMAAIDDVCRRASKGDLVVFDNYFEGGTPQITTLLAPAFLEKRLTKLEATVFVESHAPLDLEHFNKLGWVIYSPGHEWDNGLIKPTYTLERRLPDNDITRKFAEQLAKKYF